MLNKKTKTIRIVAFLLAIIVAAMSIVACADSKSKRLESFQNNKLSLNLSKANLDYFPGYEHYDPTNYYKDCERFEKLALSKSKANHNKAWKIYDNLYKDAVLVVDYTYTAEIGSYENVKNEYFPKEIEYIKKTSNEMNDTLKTICAKICKSKAADEFREHINNDMLYKSYESYKPLTGEIKDLMAKETELVNQYTIAMDEVNATSDEEYNAKEANIKLGNIYVELVKIRKQIAKLKGYDNYSQYADIEIYQRDYTVEELQPLKDAAKKYGKEFDYYVYYGFPDYEMEGVTGENIISGVGYTISSFSNRAYDAYSFLITNNLISAGFDESRADVEATYNLTTTGSAAIIMKFYNETVLYDYLAYAHEMGHFAHMNLIKNPNPLFTENGCLDVMELHSNFMQTLFALKSENIFNSADYFKGYSVASLCSCIQSGCYFDDWQRRIYESEKDLTLDEINALFKEICIEYGVEEYEGMEYDWMWVPHNYTDPLYYVSYATTAFASLELWHIAKENFEEGVEVWENIIFESPFEEGYLDAINSIGFTSFADEKFTESLLSEATNYMISTEIELFGETYYGN